MADVSILDMGIGHGRPPLLAGPGAVVDVTVNPDGISESASIMAPTDCTLLHRLLAEGVWYDEQ